MGNPEYTNFRCAPQCPSVERFEANISSRSFPTHAHEGFVIGIVHRGVQELTHCGVVYRVPAGSLVFLNPDELHAVCAANELGVTYQTLHVPADLLCALGGDTFRFSQPVEHAPQFSGKLKKRFKSLDDPSTATDLWFARLTEVLIDVVTRQDSISHRAQVPLDGRIHRLVEHIGDHIASPLSLVALASEVDMSLQHLIRSFKQAMGVTPHTYIQARRTALAKQLLRTNAPADAAASAGFADQSHLTRWMSLGALAATASPGKRAGAGVALHGVSFMPYEGYLGQDMDAFLVMECLLATGGGIDKPAAILVETVQGEGGLRSASAQWLQRVQNLARSLGALLIVDDIQAGCGRCGDFFSFEALGVCPDLVCLSKSLSGYGLPMSVTLIRPDLDVWQPGEHNGTFRGNSLAFVTARAAIEQFWRDPSFAHSLRAECEHLELMLHSLRQNLDQQHGIEVTIPGRGFMRGIDVGNGEHAAAARARSFKDGLLVETCGVNGQVLKLLPALTIENDQLEKGLSILGRAIAATRYPALRKVA